ncbi:alpha-galactosidase [Candidatus Poribacteria bacterium]|jgi:hypothetical protein|nr:alpha-galactosidase [Candidatus Poribacteria bacterium]MBT5714474.1 alpha-galactosidase [Candidatus Poribacteria bacterium]MBT7101493.1 alpha-galactosidase [Candidatus Poribacteria bacterium]MBT7806549.1 alpha-galactosidase [Candidatus Poribacteria bacterium]
MTASDWLVTRVHDPVTVRQSTKSNGAARELVLSNGLVRRAFRLDPNAATVELSRLGTDTSVLRGVKPEAVAEIDGVTVEIGGLKGQPDYAYLDPAGLSELTADPDAFQFVGYAVSEPEAPYEWRPANHSADAPFPAEGKRLTLEFAAPDSLATGLRALVHYEMYVGLPALAKWLTFRNDGEAAVRIDGLVTELLAVTEDEKPRVHVESEFAFAGMDTTAWVPDADYLTQVDYEYQSPILLKSHYPLGPGAVVNPGESWSSFRTVVLLHDADDRERQGLARRRMYRTLAPQVTENPVLMHVRSSDTDSVRAAIDQCAAVGFEMVIMTFGSGYNIESEDAAYIGEMKALADYAHDKGILLGGYTLMCASRGVGAEHDCISPDTGEPGSKFGQSACLASGWSDGYFERVLNFIDRTGMDVIETDGPYHGDVCASTAHPHHDSLDDSQVRQWERCAWFYRECRKRGVYINTPDTYFLSGSNKCGMGYRETNFSLPRWRQITIARQNIYDATYAMTPSMGWMFVPLVEYHGGGEAAIFEPLRDHLPGYEWYLAQNFGSGVQACYRGPRLFDAPETKAVVEKWTGFYHRYRPILDSDIIHVRRADGRSVDCMLHVNPELGEKGLAMVFNPTDRHIETTLRLPLYYTGLTRAARIREQDGGATRHELDRGYCVDLPVSVGAKAITWFVIEAG